MGLPITDNTTVAVITGGHAFDVPAFHALFDNIPGTDCYIQHLEDFATDVGNILIRNRFPDGGGRMPVETGLKKRCHDVKGM